MKRLLFALILGMALLTQGCAYHASPYGYRTYPAYPRAGISYGYPQPYYYGYGYRAHPRPYYGPRWGGYGWRGRGWGGSWHGHGHGHGRWH